MFSLSDSSTGELTFLQHLLSFSKWFRGISPSKSRRCNFNLFVLNPHREKRYLFLQVWQRPLLDFDKLFLPFCSRVYFALLTRLYYTNCKKNCAQTEYLILWAHWRDSISLSWIKVANLSKTYFFQPPCFIPFFPSFFVIGINDSYWFD